MSIKKKSMGCAKINYTRFFNSFCTINKKFCTPAVYFLFTILMLAYKFMPCKSKSMSYASIKYTSFSTLSEPLITNFVLLLFTCYLLFNVGLQVYAS